MMSIHHAKQVNINIIHLHDVLPKGNKSR